MQEYKTAEFAKKVGVSTKTLRYYEQLNIIYPRVDETNGYRYYTFKDAERIIVAKRYASMGLSMKECSKLMNNTSTEQVLDKMDECHDELIRQSEIALLKAKRITELRKQTKLFVTSRNQLLKGSHKVFYYYAHVDCDLINYDPIINELMELFPFAYKLLIIDNNYDIKSGRWSLAIDDEYISLVSKETLEKLTKVDIDFDYQIPLCIEVERNKYDDNTQTIKTLLNEVDNMSEVIGHLYVCGDFDSFQLNIREMHFLVNYKINN